MMGDTVNADWEPPPAAAAIPGKQPARIHFVPDTRPTGEMTGVEVLGELAAILRLYELGTPHPDLRARRLALETALAQAHDAHRSKPATATAPQFK